MTACTLFYGNIGLAAGASETLGRGRSHFIGLLIFQLAALYVIVPVLTAGAITAEKERATLALLLVTTLSPRQIVLQKFASRMTPILSFVLLSFPPDGDHLHVRRRHHHGSCAGDCPPDLHVPRDGRPSPFCGSAIFRTTVEAALRDVCGISNRCPALAGRLQSRLAR